VGAPSLGPAGSVELLLGALARVKPIRAADRAGMTIIVLQRRQPDPRADELLDGRQTAIATDQRVRWNETGHARWTVGGRWRTRAPRWRRVWTSSATTGPTTSRSCSHVSVADALAGLSTASG
jgi:hypothetical protein